MRREQLCGSNFSYASMPLTTWLDDMADLGLPQLELWATPPHLDLFFAGVRDVDRLRHELAARELSVYCLTPEQMIPAANIAAGDEEVRRRAVAYFRRGVEIAADLGAERFFVTSGRGYENEPRRRAWQRSAESLAEIVGYANDRGLVCLLEPLQRFESNLVNNSADAADMMAQLPGADIEIVLDTVAMAVAGESVEDYLNRFDGRIGHVHLVDGRPRGHLAWGDGHLPLEQYVRELNAAGYGGKVTLEFFGDGTYAFDPRPVLQRSLVCYEKAVDALS